jgi:DNA repair exonuclease SbcCD ATPase subunit
LQGHVACPTCGQEIKDIVEAMAHHVEQEAEARKMAVACNAKYTVANKRLQRLTADLSLMEGQYQRVSNLKQQLSRYDDITYSQEELDILSKAIDTYKSGTKVSNAAELELQKITGQLALNAEKQKGLAVYDGDASIEEELTTMREVIEENKKRIAALESLRVEEAKLRHELELLEQRIETSLENHKHNEKRRLYIEKMQKAYDILHVSKFPRKLIESYSEHVQAHLTKYLDKFNIPYRAKIAEGFRIQMLNTENQEMPMVSGGQEMIVGICLRLALHKMFAQSFPMWIVDEGTTHLSESNRKAYFRLIEDIRTNKIVNQVLIIDHDPQLSTVVDRTIQL